MDLLHRRYPTHWTRGALVALPAPPRPQKAEAASVGDSPETAFVLCRPNANALSPRSARKQITSYGSLAATSTPPETVTYAMGACRASCSASSRLK